MWWGGLGEERRRSPPILNRMPPVQPGTAPQQPDHGGDALVLEGVTRTFGALKAIEDVSLSVAAGEGRAPHRAHRGRESPPVHPLHRQFPPPPPRGARVARD